MRHVKLVANNFARENWAVMNTTSPVKKVSISQIINDGSSLDANNSDRQNLAISIFRMSNEDSNLSLFSKSSRDCHIILDTGYCATVVRSDILTICRISQPDKSYLHETAKDKTIPDAISHNSNFKTAIQK